MSGPGAAGAPAPHPEGASAGHWAWFAAWAAIGAGLGLIVSVIGVITAPLSAAAGLLLWRRRETARPAVAGLLSGAGLVPLYVAFLNRGGPGRDCWRTATASGCWELMNPWPWLAVGLVLVAGGLVAARRGR